MNFEALFFLVHFTNHVNTIRLMLYVNWLLIILRRFWIFMDLWYMIFLISCVFRFYLTGHGIVVKCNQFAYINRVGWLLIIAFQQKWLEDMVWMCSDHFLGCFALAYFLLPLCFMRYTIPIICFFYKHIHLPCKWYKLHVKVVQLYLT